MSYDSLAGTGCGELVDGAHHPITLTITLHRGHRVVIGRPRFQAVHAYTEYRLSMVPVEPDVRFMHALEEAMQSDRRKTSSK